MGNLDFSANADQLKELAAYMASQINVPTIGIGGGYAPIGAIQFFDATVAPQDWLACDGSIYNIADYPQLADWYEAQHGSKNFYGGNGTTTFAVPDLQGEFLRGTGTNGHSGQGSGAAVGEHQDGTAVPDFGFNGANIYMSGTLYVSNADVKYNNNQNTRGIWPRTNVDNNYDKAYNGGGMSAVRPTNTSFLICVKAVVAGEVYSTEERVVGTWIDGKPLYQKTLIFNNTLLNDDKPTDLDKSIINIINYEFIHYANSTTTGDVVNKGGGHPRATNDWSSWLYFLKTNDSDYWKVASRVGTNLSVTECSFTIIVQYTKTTD